MTLFKALILLSALTACQMPVNSPTHGAPVRDNANEGLAEPAPDNCGAAAYRERAIGQPRSAIRNLGVTGEIRVIPQGGLVTQDYNPYRMNFYLDGAGRISRVRCG